MVSSTSSFGLKYKSSSLFQVTTLEERPPLVIVSPLSYEHRIKGWKIMTQFLKLRSILRAPVFSLSFLYVPHPIPLGCLSVFSDHDTLLSSLSKYLFI